MLYIIFSNISTSGQEMRIRFFLVKTFLNSPVGPLLHEYQIILSMLEFLDIKNQDIKNQNDFISGFFEYYVTFFEYHVTINLHVMKVRLKYLIKILSGFYSESETETKTKYVALFKHRLVP
jgi:hypothetical protein